MGTRNSGAAEETNGCADENCWQKTHWESLRGSFGVCPPCDGVVDAASFVSLGGWTCPPAIWACAAKANTMSQTMKARSGGTARRSSLMRNPSLLLDPNAIIRSFVQASTIPVAEI